MKIVNKKAYFNYQILETYEAGIVLSGFEVKSIRAGRLDLSDSFARVVHGEVILKNLYIHPFQSPPSAFQSRSDHKLLLHRKEIVNIMQKMIPGTLNLVPLSLYSKRNFFKVELGLAKSKKKFDKRRSIKEKDMQRRIDQEIKY